jgi:hypothetical protein
MPLILAIEPDRRQAAHLTTVVKRRIDAELILVGTTGEALDAIGNRVPDLVLVPALLSPQDDASLAAALRVIAAAARVQMLTIPVLGRPRPATKVGGVLSALRRGRQAAEPEGCDPGVFAEQIVSYLARAAQDRTTAADLMSQDEEFAALAAPIAVEPPPETVLEAAIEPEPAVSVVPAEFVDELVADEDEDVALALDAAVLALFSEMPPLDPIAEVTEETPAPAFPAAAIEADVYADARTMLWPAAVAPDAPAEPFEESATEPVAEPIGEPITAFVAEAIAAPVAATIPAPLVALRHEPAPLADRSDELFAAAEETAVRRPTELLPGSDWLTDEPVDDPAWPAVDELMAALDALPLAAVDAAGGNEWKPPAIVARVRAREHDAAPIARRRSQETRRTPDLTPPIAVRTAAPASAPPVPLAAVEPVPAPAAVSARAIPPPVAAPSQAPSGPRAEPEWVALIASLRHDVERLRTERGDKPAEKPADTLAGKPADKPAARPTTPAVAKAGKKAKPVQDEWGFFDPEQCGFAALLAKLEEVTDSDDGSRF